VIGLAAAFVIYDSHVGSRLPLSRMDAVVVRACVLVTVAAAFFYCVLAGRSGRPADERVARFIFGFGDSDSVTE
jgi:hypothetical protein